MRIKTVKEIGEHARENRKWLGWSQAELAEKAGVSRVWISQFERGKPTLEISLVLQTLRVLDLYIDIRPLPKHWLEDVLE